MATTRESIEDGFVWLAGLLRIALRRALVLAVFLGAFAAAVVITTRDTVSDCSEVTEAQRARLSSLARPEPGRSFVADGDAGCRDGEFAVAVVGLPATITAATERLLDEGWLHETTYMGYHRQLWRHCLRRDAAGWESIHLLVDASCDGAMRSVSAVAPEGAAACDPERRDVSTIYPPRG